MSLTKSDFSAVARAANSQILTLLTAWYPQGKVQKNEYCIGSIYGEAGQSMRVNIGDAKCGYWSDFAGDDSGTDLISLWAAKRSISLGKACRELAEQLGVRVSDANAPPQESKRITPRVEQNPVAAKPGDGDDDAVVAKKIPNWLPILPVPESASQPPKAHPIRRFPDQVWTYRNEQGQVLGYITRFTKSNGKKDIIPLVYAESTKNGAKDWQWIAFPEPRPLYLTGPKNTELPVLVVEGEKCADFAYSALSDKYEVVSWPGGGKAPAKADWTSLSGRHVILWPDVDAQRYQEKHHLAGQMRPQEEQPGWITMQRISTILQALGCRVQIVDIPAPGSVPDGYDIADILDPGTGGLESGGGGKKVALQWLARLIDVTPLNVSDAPLPSLAEKASEIKATEPPASASQEVPPSNYSDVRYQLLPAANGGVLKCRENVHIAMEGDPVLRGLVGLNRFTGLQEKLRTPPWKSEPGEWTEEDDFLLGKYLAKHYGLTVAVPDIERGVAQAARDFGFNPVTDYLDSCATKWDRVNRIEKALHRYWGTDDSEYHDLVSVMFFIGLVARAYRPGIKHDYAPVFEGLQGKGKSTALSILGGKWFADTPFDISNKDSLLAIQGVWLYEIAELDAMNRATITGIKAFMSSCSDRFRAPYARRMVNVLRTCAFAATTNQNTYFRDASGNRRFWPVKVGMLDLLALAEDRDQLFGEAVWMFRAKVAWHPTMEQESRLLKPQQEEREIPDEWMGQIYDYLNGVSDRGIEGAYLKKDRTTARELLKNALNMDIAKISQANTETMRISNIMGKLGWTKKRQSTGAREYEYLRPKATGVQNAA